MQKQVPSCSHKGRLRPIQTDGHTKKQKGRN